MMPAGFIGCVDRSKCFQIAERATRQMMTQHHGWAYCVPKEQAEKICK
jgi:hypothetical protein